MPARLLAAVGSSRGQARVALAADLAVTVEGLGKGSKRGIVHATTETQHKVKRRLLLNIIVRQRAAVLKLLAREDETLLIRGNALLVLDLGLHVVNGVRCLNIESNGLTRQGLDENLDT